MNRGTFSVVITGLLLAGVASASLATETRDAEWEKRKAEEEKKAATQFEFQCIGSTEEVSYILLFYTPWDRAGYYPVAMPPLERDILKKIAVASKRFEESPAVQKALTGEANTVLNDRLEEIHRGRFNAVYVRIGVSLHIGIAPVDESTMHVWIQEKKGKDPKAHKEKDLDEEVWVFDVVGTLKEHLVKKQVKKMPQTADYQRAWAVDDPSEGYLDEDDEVAKRKGAEGWNDPRDHASFWTYAVWPPNLPIRGIQRCMPRKAKGIRH